MSEGRIIVLAKAPRPGLAKSRIAAELDPEAAAGIAAVLLQRTLDTLGGFREVDLWVTPDDAVPEFEKRRPSSWGVHAQGEGDLGERMQRAFQGAFATGASRALVVGTDCPALTGEDVAEALLALATQDVVVGPAADGGYWLLGLRAESPGLFREVPWGTAEVLPTTLARAEEAGLSVRLLRTLSDVDCLADWRAWLRDGSP